MNMNKELHDTITFNDHAISIVTDDSILFSPDLPNAAIINNEILDLLKTDTAKTLTLLLDLVQKHEDEPFLASHLVETYRATNNEELAKQTIKNNYRKFPHFLISRCEFAALCLDENKIMEAAAALNYTFELTELYPKKSQFHLIEVITFQSLIARYFCALKDFNRAVACVEKLVEINKNIPIIESLQVNIIIETLKQHISPKNIEKLFTKHQSSSDQ